MPPTRTKPDTPPANEAEWIGSIGIAGLLDTSRTHAYRLMVAGAFGEVVDIAAEGALKAQLRVRRDAVERWLGDRRVPTRTVIRHVVKR